MPARRLLRRERIAVAAVVGVLAGLVFGAFVFAVVSNSSRSHEAKQVAVRACREVEAVKRGLRETLELAEGFAASSPVQSATQKHQEAVFYSTALARLAPVRCRP